MDANIKNAPNKVTTIATGLSAQNGATGSCECLLFAWYCSGVCFHANRPNTNKNTPIRNAPILYISYNLIQLVLTYYSLSPTLVLTQFNGILVDIGFQKRVVDKQLPLWVS